MAKPEREGRETTGGSAEDGATEATSIAGIVDQVVTLVIAVAIALAIRQFVVEPFRIPSGSMLPTLLIGDHLFVNKLAYGPRIPFTELRLPGLRSPERGDVVVFEVARPSGDRIMPVDLAPPGSPSEAFVKRLVGLPGDRLVWKNGELYVNGQRLAVHATGETFTDERGKRFSVQNEDLGACRHAILEEPGYSDPALNKGSIVVEPGRYFMMGDNRDFSRDSREWGTVRLEQLKGPAAILYWSWDVNDNMLSFFNPVNWFTAEKRWDRIFQRVRCEPVPSAAPLEAGDPNASAASTGVAAPRSASSQG